MRRLLAGAPTLEMNMTLTTQVPDRRPSYLRGGEETIMEFRRRRELDAEARVERKRQDAAEQTAELNTPGVRIRAWEHVHALRMPSDPQHPILELIATATQISLAQVRQEQRTRGRSAAPASTNDNTPAA
jgi:hypothetical protein